MKRKHNLFSIFLQSDSDFIDQGQSNIQNQDIFMRQNSQQQRIVHPNVDDSESVNQNQNLHQVFNSLILNTNDLPISTTKQDQSEYFSKFVIQDDDKADQFQSKLHFSQAVMLQAFKNVMKTKQERKIFKKNHNVLKYFLKGTILSIDLKEEQLLSEQFQLADKMQKFLDFEKKKLKRRPNSNSTLKELNNFFCSKKTSNNPQLRSLVLRKQANQIISQILIPGLFNNSQIPDRSICSYLTTLKVIGLRLRNCELLKRTQAK